MFCVYSEVQTCLTLHVNQSLNRFPLHLVAMCSYQHTYISNPGVKAFLRILSESLWKKYTHTLTLHTQRLVSFSTIHLTDLDHIFVCRATLDCLWDIHNRGVYSNGHHLHRDSHCLPSQHGSVQNLWILETERRKRDQPSNGGEPGTSLIHPTADNL